MFVSCVVILHLVIYQVTRGQQRAPKAHLKIEFISYVNPNRVEVNGFPCDRMKEALCDPYVELYVHELLESGEKREIQGFKSRTWFNTNHLTFGENFGPDILNPIILDLPSWNYVNGYSLDIGIKDQDNKFYDLIGEWTLPYKSLASTRFAFLVNSRTRLEMRITGYCGSNYYGMDCTTLCLSHQPSYTCDEATGRKICNLGYSGGLCSLWQGECEDYSCSGHGTCIAGSESLTCNCHRGYTGQFCELAFWVCEEAGKLCMNGTCIDDARLENGYRCECNQGYAGMLCDDNTDDCRSSLCQNNGTCLIEADSANCECHEVFNGTFCEHRCSENENLTRMVAAKLCLLSLGSSENCNNLIQPHPQVLLSQTCFHLKNFNCGAQNLTVVQDFPNGTNVMGNLCHWTSDNVFCEMEKLNHTPTTEKLVTYCMPPAYVRVSFVDPPELKELVKRYWYLIPTALAIMVMVNLVTCAIDKKIPMKEPRSSRPTLEAYTEVSIEQKKKRHVYEEIHEQSTTFTEVKSTAVEQTGNGAHGVLCDDLKGSMKEPRSVRPKLDTHTEVYIEPKRKRHVYDQIDEQSTTFTVVKGTAVEQTGNGAHGVLCDDLKGYEHMSKERLPCQLNSDQPASQCETPADPPHPRPSPKCNQEPTPPSLQAVAPFVPKYNKVGSNKRKVVTFSQLHGNRNGANVTPGDTTSSENIGQSSDHCSTCQSKSLCEVDATQTNKKCAKSSPGRKRLMKNPLYYDVVHAGCSSPGYCKTSRSITSMKVTSEVKIDIGQTRHEGAWQSHNESRF